MRPITNEDIKILGRLVNISTEGVVADASQVYDSTQRKNQEAINSEMKNKTKNATTTTYGIVRLASGKNDADNTDVPTIKILRDAIQDAIDGILEDPNHTLQDQLNSIRELANAINNDASFYTTIQNWLAQKADKSAFDTLKGRVDDLAERVAYLEECCEQVHQYMDEFSITWSGAGSSHVRISPAVLRAGTNTAVCTIDNGWHCSTPLTRSNVLGDYDTITQTGTDTNIQLVFTGVRSNIVINAPITKTFFNITKHVIGTDSTDTYPFEVVYSGTHANAQTIAAGTALNLTVTGKTDRDVFNDEVPVSITIGDEAYTYIWQDHVNSRITWFNGDPHSITIQIPASDIDGDIELFFNGWHESSSRIILDINPNPNVGSTPGWSFGQMYDHDSDEVYDGVNNDEHWYFLNYLYSDNWVQLEKTAALATAINNNDPSVYKLKIKNPSAVLTEGVYTITASGNNGVNTSVIRNIFYLRVTPSGKDGEFNLSGNPQNATKDNTDYTLTVQTEPVPAAQTYTVTYNYNLSQVNITNKPTSVAAGGTFSASMVAKSGYMINSIETTMGGQPATIYQNVGTSPIDISVPNVNGNIVVEITSSGSTYTVTKNINHVTWSGPNGSDTTVSAEGVHTYDATVTPASGYQIDSLTVTVGGYDRTSNVYNSSTGRIYISTVSGNIVISGTTSQSGTSHISNVSPASFEWVAGSSSDHGDKRVIAYVSVPQLWSSNMNINQYVDVTLSDSTNFTYRLGYTPDDNDNTKTNVEVGIWSTTNRDTDHTTLSASATINYKENGATVETITVPLYKYGYPYVSWKATAPSQTGRTLTKDSDNEYTLTLSSGNKTSMSGNLAVVNLSAGLRYKGTSGAPSDSTANPRIYDYKNGAPSEAGTPACDIYSGQNIYQRSDSYDDTAQNYFATYISKNEYLTVEVYDANGTLLSNRVITDTNPASGGSHGIGGTTSGSDYTTALNGTDFKVALDYAYSLTLGQDPVKLYFLTDNASQNKYVVKVNHYDHGTGANTGLFTLNVEFDVPSGPALSGTTNASDSFNAFGRVEPLHYSQQDNLDVYDWGTSDPYSYGTEYVEANLGNISNFAGLIGSDNSQKLNDLKTKLNYDYFKVYSLSGGSPTYYSQGVEAETMPSSGTTATNTACPFEVADVVLDGSNVILKISCLPADLSGSVTTETLSSGTAYGNIEFGEDPQVAISGAYGAGSTRQYVAGSRYLSDLKVTYTGDDSYTYVRLTRNVYGINYPSMLQISPAGSIVPGAQWYFNASLSYVAPECAFEAYDENNIDYTEGSGSLHHYTIGDANWAIYPTGTSNAVTLGSVEAKYQGNGAYYYRVMPATALADGTYDLAMSYTSSNPSQYPSLAAKSVEGLTISSN